MISETVAVEDVSNCVLADINQEQSSEYNLTSLSNHYRKRYIFY